MKLYCKNCKKMVIVDAEEPLCPVCHEDNFDYILEEDFDVNEFDEDDEEDD